MLTVACVLVEGEYPYSVEYVKRLEAMVKRYLHRPYRFVCLTDQPNAMPAGVEPLKVERIPGALALWTKMRLFDVDRSWRGRVLYLDLDTLVVSSLDPIVDYPADFALTEDAPASWYSSSVDKHKRQIVRKFNSSVMVWDAGLQRHLWESLTKADIQRLSTDQDFIAEKSTDAVGMPLAWFPRISQLVKDDTFAATGAPMPADAKVVLTKKPKNHIACERWPWFEPMWGSQ